MRKQQDSVSRLGPWHWGGNRSYLKRSRPKKRRKELCFVPKWDLPWKFSNENTFPSLLYCFWSIPQGMLIFLLQPQLHNLNVTCALLLVYKSHHSSLWAQAVLWWVVWDWSLPTEIRHACDTNSALSLHPLVLLDTIRIHHRTDVISRARRSEALGRKRWDAPPLQELYSLPPDDFILYALGYCSAISLPKYHRGQGNFSPCQLCWIRSCLQVQLLGT